MQFHTLGKYLHGWSEVAKEDARLNKLMITFFELCIQRLRLTPQAVMTFFNVSYFIKMNRNGKKTNDIYCS